MPATYPKPTPGDSSVLFLGVKQAFPTSSLMCSPTISSSPTVPSVPPSPVACRLSSQQRPPERRVDVNRGGEDHMHSDVLDSATNRTRKICQNTW
eukprot:2283462-Rhodomonas_salina.1